MYLCVSLSLYKYICDERVGSGPIFAISMVTLGSGPLVEGSLSQTQEVEGFLFFAKKVNNLMVRFWPNLGFLLVPKIGPEPNQQLGPEPNHEKWPFLSKFAG